MQQRNGSDLLINPMLRIRYPQMPPHLGSITVETENTVAIVDQHLLKSLFKNLGLLIASIMDQFNTSTQLADRDGG